MVEFAEKRAAELGVAELWLTVNKHNAGSIAFYEKTGFRKTAALVTDIGGGFVMVAGARTTTTSPSRNAEIVRRRRDDLRISTFGDTPRLYAVRDGTRPPRPRDLTTRPNPPSFGRARPSMVRRSQGKASGQDREGLAHVCPRRVGCTRGDASPTRVGTRTTSGS